MKIKDLKVFAFNYGYKIVKIMNLAALPLVLFLLVVILIIIQAYEK